MADERARNLTTIVEILVNDFKEEITQPGPPQETAPPVLSRYFFDETHKEG